MAGAGSGDVGEEMRQVPRQAEGLSRTRMEYSGEESGAILFSPRGNGREFGEGERNLIHAVGRQALAALTGKPVRKAPLV